MKRKLLTVLLIINKKIKRSPQSPISGAQSCFRARIQQVKNSFQTPIRNNFLKFKVTIKPESK